MDTSKMLKWLKGQNEYSLLLYALLLWFAYPRIAQLVDPSTIGLDPVFIQFVLYATVAFSIINSFVWLVFKVIWPSLAEYMDKAFRMDFYTITSWQRILLVVGLFCFFIWCLVTLSQNVLIK